MATKTDAANLTDILTRYQIYLEGLKLEQSRKFSPILKDMETDLQFVLARLQVDNLADLTKRQLLQLRKSLRKVQLRYFNKQGNLLLRDLEAFLEADLSMNAEIFKQTQEFDERSFALLGLALTRKKRASLWASILRSFIPGLGTSPRSYMKKFNSHASDMLDTVVNTAYTDRASTVELSRRITGQSRLGYRDGLTIKYFNQGAALTSTIMQHVATQATTRLASIFYEYYFYIAILDSSTTTICRSRHKKRYRYGEGPLTPAHFRCRSRIVPDDGSPKRVPDTFYAWITDQPRVVQDDILGAARSRLLRKNQLGPIELRKFNDAKALTLTQFKSKLPLILAT